MKSNLHNSSFQRKKTDWCLLLASIVFLAVGFAGMDRWFYEKVSLWFNHDDGVSYDAYQQSKFCFMIVRYSFAHMVGVMLAFFLVLSCCKQSGLRRANAMILSVIVVSLLAHFLQMGICRLRPNQADSHLAFQQPFSSSLTAQGVGFPSGEVATGAALALVLAFIFPKYRYLFFIAAVLVYIARVLPGNHYISDASASVLLALLVTPLIYNSFVKLFIPDVVSDTVNEDEIQNTSPELIV